MESFKKFKCFLSNKKSCRFKDTDSLGQGVIIGIGAHILPMSDGGSFSSTHSVLKHARCNPKGPQALPDVALNDREFHWVCVVLTATVPHEQQGSGTSIEPLVEVTKDCWESFNGAQEAPRIYVFSKG